MFSTGISPIRTRASKDTKLITCSIRIEKGYNYTQRDQLINESYEYTGAALMLWESHADGS